jgi:hypothetical protein
VFGIAPFGRLILCFLQAGRCFWFALTRYILAAHYVSSLGFLGQLMESSVSECSSGHCKHGIVGGITVRIGSRCVVRDDGTA